jgi:hypothetical protein
MAKIVRTEHRDAGRFAGTADRGSEAVDAETPEHGGCEIAVLTRRRVDYGLEHCSAANPDR